MPAGLSRSTAPEPKPVTQTATKATPASKPAAITSTPEDRKDPADEPKAEAETEKPKPAAKAKPTFGIRKAEPKAEPEPVADEPEEADPEPVANETVNTMSGGAGGASEPGPEEEAPAPKPRGIFAKVGNG